MPSAEGGPHKMAAAPEGLPGAAEPSKVRTSEGGSPSWQMAGKARSTKSTSPSRSGRRARSSATVPPQRRHGRVDHAQLPRPGLGGGGGHHTLPAEGHPQESRNPKAAPTSPAAGTLEPAIGRRRAAPRRGAARLELGKTPRDTQSGQSGGMSRQGSPSRRPPRGAASSSGGGLHRSAGGGVMPGGPRTALTRRRAPSAVHVSLVPRRLAARSTT